MDWNAVNGALVLSLVKVAAPRFMGHLWNEHICQDEIDTILNVMLTVPRKSECHVWYGKTSDEMQSSIVEYV